MELVPKYSSWFESPIGFIEIIQSGEALSGIFFREEQNSEQTMSPLLKEATKQLNEYFKKQRRIFDLPLQPEGTSFQRKVWEELKKIPYGKTKSYKELALSLGDPKKVRAVGMANGKNPLSIVLPCHRVLGSNGRLTGYAGGLWRKEWLLKHEGYFLF